MTRRQSIDELRMGHSATCMRNRAHIVDVCAPLLSKRMAKKSEFNEMNSTAWMQYTYIASSSWIRKKAPISYEETAKREKSTLKIWSEKFERFDRLTMIHQTHTHTHTHIAHVEFQHSVLVKYSFSRLFSPGLYSFKSEFCMKTICVCVCSRVAA